MIRSILLFVLPIIVAANVYGQKDSLSKADKILLDSLLKNDAFLNLVSEKKKSTIDVSIGLGNGSFSSHNRAVNATGVTNLLVVTPSLFYHHKSGFSVGITTYITSDSTSSGVYQTGISGSYDYAGKLFNAGISYTRYLSNKNKYNNKSIYQNDIFGYAKLAKGVIQPLLMLGYANGIYKELDYIKFRRPLIGDTILVRDSTNNKTSYFSVTAGIGHEFNFYKVFSANDELDINPTIVVNAGTDNLTSTHTNRAYDRVAVLNRRKKTVQDNNKFQLQSVAGTLDLTYSIGKFYVQPSIYADYYLPSTTGNRWSFVYSFTVGISF